MFNKVSAQDILIAHIYLCHALKLEAKLVKPGVLKDIESQLNNNLSWFSPLELAAYVGLHLIKQKPFAFANKATAASMVMAITRDSSGLSAQEIVAVLESSSIVDEVADRLVLTSEH